MTYDVETSQGRDFCGTLMDIDDAHGIKASFQVVTEQRSQVRPDYRGERTCRYHAQTVVMGNKDPDFGGVPEHLRAGQLLVDFVRIIEGRSNNGKYNGICW